MDIASWFLNGAMNQAIQLQNLNLADPDVKTEKFPLLMAALILNAKKYTIGNCKQYQQVETNCKQCQEVHPDLHRLIILTEIETNCKQYQQVAPDVLKSSQILKEIESSCMFYQGDVQAEQLQISQIGDFEEVKITDDGLIICQPLKSVLPIVVIEGQEKKKAQKLAQKKKGKGKEEEEQKEKKKVIPDDHIVRLTPIHAIPEYYGSGGTKHDMFINIAARIINGFLGLNIRGNRVMSEELAKELFIPNGTEEEYAILTYIEHSPPVAKHKLVKYTVMERMQDYLQVEHVDAKFMKKIQVDVGKGKKKIEEI